MKFTYLELNNYIGIYSGLGLYKIQIDFTKGSHRVCIIKGTNGSGKSTIMNALSLFPDKASSFIPGLPASKIVRVLHKENLYEIKFFSEVKQNGTRETTKAYITKNGEELNPNGNVNTYKDITFMEFRLDTNFFALSKLSMDDRGIGYKTPSERKKFVNSITESLEVYNDIYKAVTKKLTSLKAIMASITANLNNLGNKESLESMRDSIERDIESLRKERDEATIRVGRLESAIASIDRDGSIQQVYRDASARLREERNRFDRLARSYTYPNRIFSYEVDAKILGDQLAELYKWIELFKNQRIELISKSQSLINQAASIRERIRSLTESTDSADLQEIEQLKASIGDVTSEAADLAILISDIGIDPNAFTKDEYILALETMHEIVSQVDMLRFQFPFDILTACINAYTESGYNTIDALSYDVEKIMVDSAPKIMSQFSTDIAKAQADVELTKKLADRPAECKIDSCYFIADAIKAMSNDPQSNLDKLMQGFEVYKKTVEDAQATIAYREQYNNCANMLRVIFRSIDKNNSILSRLPNGGIFSSKVDFIAKLVGGESFEFIDRVYQYIYLANHFDMYKKLQSQAHEYYLKLDALETKQKSYEKFVAMINQMQGELSGIEIQLQQLKFAISRVDESLREANDKANYLTDVVIPSCDAMKAHMDGVNQAMADIERIQSQINDIDDLATKRAQAKGVVKAIDTQIGYKEKDRDGILYKLRQIDEYNKSLEEYNKEFHMLDRLKYHSSPTTGIQLVFMKLYMGKILDIANSLLKFLFQGQYQLMPFIINEDEFRIPCSGNGYVNDDISSMSSSQMMMISMILSFSLLTASSTEYNVIKLDEVDDPLDEVNRSAFAMLMDNLMDLMHTEQCIMISHSSEIIASNADLILLKSDGLVSVNPNSSIIWDYSQQ